VAGSRDGEANARMLPAPRGRVSEARRKLNYFFTFCSKNPSCIPNLPPTPFLKHGNLIFDMKAVGKATLCPPRELNSRRIRIQVMWMGVLKTVLSWISSLRLAHLVGFLSQCLVIT
jgi:hypothetical protein